MRSLRAGSIGSISAWLPSRRSTEHHSGACSMRLLRPRPVGSASGSGRNGRYFSNGMRFGVTGSGGIVAFLSAVVGGCGSGNRKTPCRRQEVADERRMWALAVT